MADPSFVMLDFLLALKNEAVAAGLRAEGAAEKTIWVADQAELAVAVGTLIKATRLLHDGPPRREARTRSNRISY